MRSRYGLVALAFHAAVCVAAHAAPVSGQGTWETTLQARDLDGDVSNGPEAFYDSTLNITWLREGSKRANIFEAFTWSRAKSWAEFDWYGLTGWRLPAVTDTGALGCGVVERSNAGGTDCGYNVLTKSGSLTEYEADQTIYSEMAHLYYVTLGNKALYAAATGIGPQTGYGLANTGDFLNMQSFGYWSGTKNNPDNGRSFYFRMNNGGQDIAVDSNLMYAMVVRDGDVFAVPVPGTLGLVATGLAAAMVGRRRSLKTEVLALSISS